MPVSLYAKNAECLDRRMQKVFSTKDGGYFSKIHQGFPVA